MPRLHQYRNRNACYVLTAIGGKVITYQLTPEGEKKLAAARIGPGEQFERSILLDLYRSGDAYTGGSGVDDPLASQMEMDFANDPVPETAFPACDICKSVNDLHLTLRGIPDKLAAQLQCPTCRDLPGAQSDTIIPVALLSRPLLSRLFQMKTVAARSLGVKLFEELLRAEFESKWEALRKRRGNAQTSLFDIGTKDGLGLD